MDVFELIRAAGELKTIILVISCTSHVFDDRGILSKMTCVDVLGLIRAAEEFDRTFVDI